ncbi:dopamine N-acetyltransferase-like [Thrips palmi]|uniref:Dopamine N-acetyltransferase-like n=1 Tax=Thrips palmi TaxID=161013 RepID=A0A6P8ZPM3_THRPL|nr:dopamine N-acetyltransferase-like [Thrips palmi]
MFGRRPGAEHVAVTLSLTPISRCPSHLAVSAVPLARPSRQTTVPAEDMCALRVQRVAADDAKAHEAVAEVMRRGFLPHESACHASRVSQDPDAERELLDLVRAALADGVSVAVYIGDDMVGAAVNKIQVRPPPGGKSFFERFYEERASRPATRFVLDFMAKIDAQADLFAEAGGDPILELMFLGVVPEAGRRGVGQRLTEETVQLARSVRVKAVSAIWTSDYSRAIGARLGFKELTVADHSTFSFEGTTIAQAAAPHQQRSVLALFKLPAESRNL